MDKVAPVNPDDLEKEALAAAAEARSLAALSEVRVRYLGRRSALKLALRHVRDRDTGMTLNAVRETVDFLTTKGLSRDEAYSLTSIVGDCRVSQVVDVRKGVHCMIPKSIFK